VGEDPAPTSAGASKPQAKFQGSDRQARGRAMRAVGNGITTQKNIVQSMSLEHDEPRALKLLDALVDEGLILRNGNRFTLP
jgi:A/G-specific adenine glycosylase